MQNITLIENFDMSADALPNWYIDAFGVRAQVGRSGKIHIQFEHSFDNEFTVITPNFSISEGATGLNYAPFTVNGTNLSVSLSGSVTSLIITDLLPGTFIKFGMDYGFQETGTITIKIAT